MNLSDRNMNTKVIVEEIVFLQGDDYEEYLKAQDCWEMSFEEDVKYLLQWYESGKHMENTYHATGINTHFLGKLIKIPGYKGYFLLAKNTSVGYIGLSKVVRFEHSEPVKHWTDKFVELLNVRAK